jgi:imidazolonepropionase-like amidohydrolase
MHRLRFSCTFLAALASATCVSLPAVAAAQPPTVAVTAAPYVPGSGSIAIRCGTLIDGVADRSLPASTVIIRRGRITAVTRGVSSDIDLPTLDLRDYVCLPGLIEMHDHITESAGDTADLTIYFRRTAQEQWALSRQQAEQTLRAGFTTVRNVGVYRAWTDRQLRDAINGGEVAGPRMQVSGFYLTIPGGGGELPLPGTPPVDSLARFRAGVARGPEMFRARAMEAVAGGADLIKVIASGAVLAYGGVPGQPEMTPEELAAVVQVAHAAGLKVAAHAHGAQSIKDAIRAGADTIEHASLIDDEGIDLALRHGVALSMDVYNGDYIDTEGRAQGWPEEFLRKNLETTEAQRQAFTRAYAAGVAIVYGTDAGVYPHGLNARQFPIMVERGMTPMAAIQSATSVAARFMGWEDRVGQVTPGRFGDVIAVKCDPLADIRCLQDVAVVIKDGLAFKLP